MTDWKTVQLGEVCTLQRGMDLPKRLRHDGEFPLVTSSGIDGTHSVGPVKGPGVITGRYGTIGKVFFVEQDFWPLNTTLYVRDFHGNDVRFVHHLLHTVDFQSHSGKSGVPGVNRNDVHQEFVHIPVRRSEQEAIAKALLDADALIDSLEQLLTKKRQIKQGAMQELLTGKLRLPGFEGAWRKATVRDLELSGALTLSRGKVISKKSIADKPGLYPIYSSSIHNNGLFGCYGDFMFDEELITWSVDGGGNFFYRPKHKFSVTNVCGYMRVRAPLNCRFIAFQLEQQHSSKMFDYQTKAHPSVVRAEYLIALPEEREQVAIAQILSDIDTEITALESRLTKARALKQAMAQALLTGRIRLMEGTAT